MSRITVGLPGSELGVRSGWRRAVWSKRPGHPRCGSKNQAGRKGGYESQDVSISSGPTAPLHGQKAGRAFPLGMCPSTSSMPQDTDLQHLG